MDLHALSLGRAMLVVRGGIASVWGVLHLGLAMAARKKVTHEVGTRLLAPR